MASSSSSPTWKYDVFLSFRGEDTRKNFVSHLHKELVIKGIVTFLDDKRLKISDFISAELTTAIKESRFALVVLSENYASSRWCLDELLMIMDLHFNKGMKVVPIFYGVDPSHVRHQTGSFTLDKYQVPEMANKLEKWREALTQIASIVGKDTSTCVNEALMIEDIVEDISNQLFVMQPVDFSDLVGMEDHMERLNPLLSMKSKDEVRMIGIWGMGGIGKTTIAWRLFDRFSRLFPFRCFLENVSNICSAHDVSYLRKKFLSTTLCLPENSSVEVGPQEIKARFGHRKVFVVLDNVDDMKQVHALAKDPGWFGPGSRIIITTRDKRLLNSCGVKNVYEVKCLDADASLKRFNQLAFEKGFPPDEDYEDMSIQASCLAQGLPAAIEAYGLFFRGVKSYMEWKDALSRFSKAPTENVMEILKISYNGLEEADKNVLLHVACLLNGEPLRRAIALLDDGKLQGCLGIKILADKSLIEISAGGYIKIHSLVDQTVKAIVKKEPVPRSEGRRVLWDSDEICKVLKRNAANDPTECMVLHMCDMVYALHLGEYPKEQDDTLKFLKVYKHLDHIETKLHLSSNDAYLLSSSLRLLHWDAFPLTNFPCRFCPRDLVEVSLHRSNLTSFWKETVGIPNLRRLDLTGSKNLELLPDLSMAVNLEEVITQGCKRLKRIPESISNLTRLTKLDVSYCDDLSNYHITIKELNGHCRLITLYFSGEEVETEYIKNLAIGGNIHIQMLSFDGRTDHLCFSTEQQAPDESTKRDQQQGTNDKQLFHGHEWMMHEDQEESHDHAPPEFYGFNSIDIIRFTYNGDDASFQCYSLSMFPCLRELNLINLNIKVIPDDVCGLQFLEKVDWSGNDFETLPETMNQLHRLKYLSLCNCRRLEALPKLVQLETVKLSSCMSFQSLLKISHSEQDWGSWRLRELWVDDCNNIQSISDQLGRYIKLSYVDLSGNDFETLPSSITDLSSLRTLCLNKCMKLKSIEGFPLGLKYLCAHGCESLETISFPLSHSIKHLDLSHCFRLKQDEHLITQFLNEGQDEEDSPRFACFPGTEVPSYFDNIGTGKSYTIDLPWPTPKLVGFDGCIVIACERPFHIQFSPLSYDYDWGSERCFHLDLQPDLFHCGDSSFLHSSKEEAVNSDHLVIIRGIKNISRSAYKFGIQSNLQLWKEVKSPPAEIKSCGFRLIWGDDLRDKVITKKKKMKKTLTSRFSSLFKSEKLKNTSKSSQMPDWY